MRNNIKKVACVGSGLIGQGWTTLFLAKGYEVTLQDLSQDLLKSATEQVALNLTFMESNGLLQKGKAVSTARNIGTTTELAEAVGGADYIQESVFDNYPVKKEVFKALDALVPHSHTRAESFIYFRRTGNAGNHQIHGLAQDSSLESIDDITGNFLFEQHRDFAKFYHQIIGQLHGLRRGLPAADDLHQRYKMNGKKRMGQHTALRTCDNSLNFTHQQPGAAAGNNRVDRDQGI